MYELNLKDRQRIKFIRDNYDMIRLYNENQLKELAQKFETSYNEIIYDIQTISYTKFNMKYYK